MVEPTGIEPHPRSAEYLRARKNQILITYKRAGSIYLAEVENQWVKGKVVQRFIRYVGKEVDGRTVLSTSASDAHIQEVKLYGPLLVLHHLAEKIGLPTHFGTYAPEILSPN